MDLDGADNPWADAPPSNSASREHLPSGPLPVDTFAAAFPTPSPTASASNSFTPRPPRRPILPQQPPIQQPSLCPPSQTSAFASSSQSNDADALFGDFGAPTQTPAAKADDFAFSPNASNDAGAESDGFGDFADFTTAAPLAPILQSLVSGASLPVTGVFDLQSYLAASADPTAPASTAPSPVPQLHIPLVHTAPDGTCSPRVSINPVFAATAGDGYDAILRLAEAPLFDEHISTRIRWRKCLIKKMFQAALEMPVDWDDKGDNDLRARTDDDLAHIQGVLASAVPGLHAQINYYLDAREQLALDAEMHNKMISVLVQQAQKSHGRFAKKSSPPKRK
ncbi:hypothetical protein BCR44DRAFT_1482797 [Catenaria anguillulae PL171]|uniref:Uncharacterized protein n=1 Tax=Catenaria anguillulae PL171 TaxID=765915 RepID=A0A1Y2HY88_9FUNG|nr:hypothetical protein BCR44DRAFT_1482797 [Catenaria anguillulae PL171]